MHFVTRNQRTVTQRQLFPRRQSAVLATTLGGLVLVVAACGGSVTSPAAQPSSPPQSSSQQPTPAQATPVMVSMTDFKLTFSRTDLPPGTYTFTAVNQGKAPHALEVSGPGVQNQRTPGNLQPGQSADLTVTLQPGTYEFICPVDSHKERGMDVFMTVGGAQAPATTSAGGAGGTGGGY